MSKLIEVREQRACCQPRDLLPIHGSPHHGMDVRFKFCPHCGTHFVAKSMRDPAGATDTIFEPLALPWESTPRPRGVVTR